MDGVPMETHSQRWPADVWAAVANNARYLGVSPSAFVRVGGFGYAAYTAARRRDPVPEGFDKLWAAAWDLLEVYDLDK